MSKKSLLLGLLCSGLLISNHIKAETDVIITTNETTIEVVNQEPIAIKVEDPVTTVVAPSDIPSEPYEVVEPVDVVEPIVEESVDTVDVSTSTQSTSTTLSEVSVETTTQVTEPTTSNVVTQPTVTTETYSNEVYSTLVSEVSEVQSTAVESITVQSNDISVASVNEKPVGTLIRLGVSDKSKPVGSLKFYTQHLPNTSSENKNFGIISGVVLLMGLLIHGLYYFSKRIFS